MVSTPFEYHAANVIAGPPREYSHRLRFNRKLFLFTDIAMVFLVGAFSVWLRFVFVGAGRYPLDGKRLAGFVSFFLLYAALVAFFCGTQKLYRGTQVRSPLMEATAIFRSVAMASTVISSFAYFAHSEPAVSRFILISSAALTVIALTGWRHVRRFKVRRRVDDGHDAHRVLIVGEGSVARALMKCFSVNKQLGYTVVGLVALDACCDRLDDRVLGSVDELSAIARANFIDAIFITVPEQREIVKQVAIEARQAGLAVSVVPELYDGLAWGAPIEYVGNFPTIALHEAPIPAGELLLKRMVDVVSSASAILLLSPLMLLIALLIKLDSAGPVLFFSRRVGKKGRIFPCIKFRTMVQNAEEIRASLAHLNEREGVLFKIAADPRITPLGRFLRKYSFDELPQLWNVLKGEMSLVGPRPPSAEEVERYSLEHLRRLDVTPGITGLWQVRARRDPSFATYLREDIDYIERWSIWLDVKILFQTIRVVLLGTGQ